MHDYDVAFKTLLQQSVDLIREIAGTTIARWLSVELPEVQNTRVDLLGETAGGELVHIELQSTNDSTMALRMAEYYLPKNRNTRRQYSAMRSAIVESFVLWSSMCTNSPPAVSPSRSTRVF